MRSVPSLPVVGPFADRLLSLDLPTLPDDRRAEVVAFIARRVDGMPSVTRIGVVVLATAVRGVLALPGGSAVVPWLAGHPLPLLAEYVRLVRSLGYAYVWETWPATQPDGAAA
jgi:hypothetical protein